MRSHPLLAPSTLRRLAITLAAAAAPLLAACHSSSTASTPPGIYCRAVLAGETVCYGYSNLDAYEKTAVSDACTSSLQGTIGGSCPDGELGCCTTTTAGYDTTECYYAGMASAFEAACNEEGGTWKAGGPGGSSSSQDGGASGVPSGSDAGSGVGSMSGNGSGSGSGQSYPPPSNASCPSGLTECPNGCVDESSDSNNCGSCGYACPPGPSGTAPSCVAGACTYRCANPSETLCDADEGGGTCVNLQTSEENCGECDNECPYVDGASGSCQAGSCQTSCGAGQAFCSGSCIEVTSDPSNCGGCGESCDANAVCTNGACFAGCSAGQTLCSGVCTDLEEDASNCGACGSACTEYQAICLGGACSCEVNCYDELDEVPFCCSYGQSCGANTCM